ncbi:alpha/beta hydrolase family protein [Microbacterium sp. KNMS]
MTEERAAAIRVELPAGAVELPAAVGAPDGAWATLAIAHGAGAGKDHPFLVGFAAAVRDAGIATVRFDFPYIVAGRRMPGPAAHAIAAWRAVAGFAAASLPAPLWACGKSYGGRMASMAATEGAFDVAGLVYLAYPLHPPGRPEKPRAEHLPEVAPPQLFVEGENDPFIQPRAQFDDAVASCQDATVEWIAGGTHAFEVKGRRRPADEIGASLADPVVRFIRQRSGG